MNVQITPHFSTPQQGSFVLKIDGSAAVNTMFWRLMGQQQVNITASGEVVWGIKKLNLALALDNTGSMASSNKMTALKEAAHNLLNTLQKAEKAPGDIKISIVPFAVDVNVGTEHVGASWIDWEDWNSKNGTCSKSWLQQPEQLRRPTAAPGRHITTACGTAASWTATRTMTSM